MSWWHLAQAGTTKRNQRNIWGMVGNTWNGTTALHSIIVEM